MKFETLISGKSLKKRTPICVKALDVFISIFGSVAGNLAMVGWTQADQYPRDPAQSRLVVALVGGKAV